MKRKNCIFCKILLSLALVFMIVTNFLPIITVLEKSMMVYAETSTTKAKSVEKSFEFSADKKTLSLGKTLKYKPNKKGFDSNAKPTYTSSNTNVATVDQDGKVTSIARGETIITATLEGMTTSYELTVIPGTVSMYSKSTNEKVKGTVVLEKNEERDYYIQDEYNSILPSEVEWKSSKEAVCTVDEEGTIKTIDNGNATITASVNNISKLKGNLRINVKTPVEEILVDDSVHTYVGEIADIYYVVLPEDASNMRLKFQVEDKDIATVTSNGKVKGKAEGTTTVKISSISNPEITNEVQLIVEKERNYDIVKISSIIEQNDGNNSTFIAASDGSYRVAKSETISILNNYGEDAVFTNNNENIISVKNDDDVINVKSLKDGVATITVDYANMQDTIKIISGNYIDKTILQNIKENKNGGTVEKIALTEDPNDSTKEINYLKDYPLEVGVGYDLDLKISPKEASIEDLNIKLSNEKDFVFEDGMIKALNPNKTTDLIVSSKTNSKVNKKIKLKSSIGNVSEVYFANSYVGENIFDINKSKKYTFNPIFVMESGKTYNPIENPEIIDDSVYKELKKNVKITTEDTDVVTVSSNTLTLKEGINGAGILKIEYNKLKNVGATKESEDIVAETNFETIGKVVETIKSIKFAKKEYNLASNERIAFNPIITLSSGRKLDPTKEGVAESEEYQQFLKEVGLCNGTINENYTTAEGLINFTYLSNINSNNIIQTVYEGKCKIKMVVHFDNSICDETVLNIRSPYVEKNEQQGLKVAKTINATRYVNTDKLIVNPDGKSEGEVGTLSRGDAIWVFETYTNGSARVAYNGNEDLYVQCKYLTESKEKTVKKETVKKETKSYFNSSSSTSSINRGKVTTVNTDKIVKLSSGSLNIRSDAAKTASVIGSLTNGAKVYQYDVDSNGWAKIKLSGGTIGYVNASYLDDFKKSSYYVPNTTIIAGSSKSNK